MRISQLIDRGIQPRLHCWRSETIWTPPWIQNRVASCSRWISPRLSTWLTSTSCSQDWNLSSASSEVSRYGFVRTWPTESATSPLEDRGRLRGGVVKVFRKAVCWDRWFSPVTCPPLPESSNILVYNIISMLTHAALHNRQVSGRSDTADKLCWRSDALVPRQRSATEREQDRGNRVRNQTTAFQT